MQPTGGVDLFAGQDVVLLTRYEGSGQAELCFEGKTTAGPVRWTTNVEFPERERDNAFIPRLWATQRLGWLSAEKRRSGGNPEIDAEIRELGERYGIPTEFTSYFVREPDDRRDRIATDMPTAATGGTLRPVPPPQSAPGLRPALAPGAPARPEATFEAARAAAAQRAATSLAAADNAVAAAPTGTAPTTGRVRRAGTHAFTLVNGSWRDMAWRDGIRTVKIKAYSDAYFALAARLPTLRDALALADRVLVVGRAVAIEVTDDGVERLAERDLERIEDAW
jgi:Ca-activated chloride channel family protein